MGNRLKELRQKYHLSLRKLQEYTGIDFSRLAVIEKSDANIEVSTLEKLSSFYKVSITYLLGKDGFIEYYDIYNEKCFPMAYEQYKNVLTSDVVSWSIVDGSIRRTISIEGYGRIDKVDNAYTRSLNLHIAEQRLMNYINSLSIEEAKQLEETIISYINRKDVQEKLKQIKETLNESNTKK